ncbi:hypothetical protein KJ909_02865 [Patescibacteria group bacterium]|nr:hypothetical protein [Patescibacteria group bacterium]
MESSKFKIIFLFLFLNLLFLNFGLALLWQKKQPPVSSSILTSDDNYRQNLENDIKDLKAKLIQIQSASISASLSPFPTSSPVSKNTTVSYVPVPGSGSLLVYQWTNLPGTEFYFNPADFPNLSEAYFEANMKLLNGNGLAFLRLFDLTAGIEIWGSEIQTASQTDTMVVSSPLTFRSGNHLLCVQAKSLTADTTVFNSGRLKITNKN